MEQSHKIFLVEVAALIPVLANDSREASQIVDDNFNDIERYDFSFYSSMEIKDRKRIPSEWMSEVPFQRISNIKLSCKEIFDMSDEFQRLKMIKEEKDKPQLKFNI